MKVKEAVPLIAIHAKRYIIKCKRDELQRHSRSIHGSTSSTNVM